MRHLTAFILGFSLLLTACVSSGGGGGGNAAPPAPVPTAEYDIFSVPPANETGTVIERDGNPNNPADDYLLIQRTADGIKFTYRDVANRDLLGDSLSMRSFEVYTGAGSQPSDFNSSGNYLRAEKTSAPVTTPDGGTFTSTEIIEVGGKTLGLQYADFGMWKTIINYNGSGGVITRMNEPEILDDMENRAYRAAFTAGTGTESFTGNAMGVVRAHNSAYSDDVAAPLGAEVYGTASLDVNLTNLRATLDLLFPGFYDFSFTNLSVDRSGELDEIDRTTQLSVTNNGNATGINLNTVSGVTGGFDVDGQFYGPSRNNPTEAVGDVEIRQTAVNGVNNYVDVDIAFGVKK